jgi:ferrochelatase
VWPLAFVSDHIETLVEIDVEYAAMAKQLGIQTFQRVKNFDADPDFVSLLTSIVTRGARDLQKNSDSPLLRDLAQRPAGPYCASQPAGCLCANYYLSGRQGLERGTAFARVAPKNPSGPKKS